MGSRPSLDEAPLPGLAQPAPRADIPKIEHWVHDAVDLASGRIATTTLAHALTKEVRAKQLAELGFKADLSFFHNPMYRLTPQTPYQSTPEAWLDAFDGTYNAGPSVDQ